MTVEGLSRRWVGVLALAALGIGCDPIRVYQAPGRLSSALVTPRNESVGEQTYEISVKPDVTYRLHAHWFFGRVHLFGELENRGVVPIIVDDRQAALQVPNDVRARAGTLTPGTELFVGEISPGDRHKTHFIFPASSLEAAADVTFTHDGLTLNSGEAVRLVVQLVDERGK